MKVFVLGRSGCGKTPFAQRVAAATGLHHVMASEWVRSRFPLTGGPGTRDDHIAALTHFSVEELRRNPAVCVEFLAARHDLTKPSVVEGVRNPYDFIRLYDPRTDVVAFLENRANALHETAFESGLSVIRAHLEFLRRADLLRAEDGLRILDYRWGVGAEPPACAAAKVVAARDFDAALEDFIPVVREALARAKGDEPAPLFPPALRPSRVHADVAPLRAHVKKEFLYGMDPAHVGQTVPCTVFAVSSYTGSTPTLKILIQDGAVFSYLPPDALVDPSRKKEPTLSLAELCYHNCPSEDVVVHAFEALAGPVLAYVKQRDLWLPGEYRFTIDWYLGNDLLHFVSLENGQFAFLPHHKLKFTLRGAEFKNATPGFEPYRKIRRTWTV
ncbi:MAG: hypothetical protein ACAI25_16250 [Planctomycetota bacterium]